MDEEIKNPCIVCGEQIPITHAQYFSTDHGGGHIGCMETKHKFYQPVHDSNGGEALYDSEELAEEAIKTHQQDTMSNNEMDEDYAREHWEIKEYEMTWAAYFALPEFDGW